MTYAALVATILLRAGGPVLFLAIALGMARHARNKKTLTDGTDRCPVD